jgi:hypothetical protein
MGLRLILGRSDGCLATEASMGLCPIAAATMTPDIVTNAIVGAFSVGAMARATGQPKWTIADGHTFSLRTRSGSINSRKKASAAYSI